VGCCLAQEPLFPTKNFENVTHRQDFCLLNRRVEDGEVALPNILTNQSIHVGVYDFDWNEETKYPSNQALSVRILDELARRGQFNWRNSYGLVAAPTSDDPTATFDSILDWGVRTYDLLMEWYVATPQRLSRNVIYPEGWFDATFILIHKTNADDSDEFKLWAFFDPFSKTVWWLILTTVIVTALISYLIDYIDSTIRQSEMSFRHGKNRQNMDLAASLVSTLHVFVGSDVADGEPAKYKSLSSRAISISTSLFFLLVISAYTANLTSFLVTKQQGNGIPIEDLDDAVSRQYSICVWGTSAMDLYLQKRYPTYKHIIPVQDEGGVYIKLNKGECDLVVDTKDSWNGKKYDIKYNPDCNMNWIGRAVEYHYASYPMHGSEQYCTSLLRKAINYHLTDMNVDGTLDRIKDTYFKEKETAECKKEEDSEEEDSPQLGIRNMGGILCFHTFTLVIALLFSLAPLFWDSQSRKRFALECQNMMRPRRGVIPRLTSMDDEEDSMRDRGQDSQEDMGSDPAINSPSTRTTFTNQSSTRSISKQQDLCDMILQQNDMISQQNDMISNLQLKIEAVMTMQKRNVTIEDMKNITETNNLKKVRFKSSTTMNCSDESSTTVKSSDESPTTVNSSDLNDTNCTPISRVADSNTIEKENVQSEE